MLEQITDEIRTRYDLTDTKRATVQDSGAVVMSCHRLISSLHWSTWEGVRCHTIS
jgi:hypothetical protein